MFPIFGVSGRIVGFGGRLLGADPKAAKYLNTPETERFQKRNLLYGLHLARGSVRERGALLLVEGYFDLLAAVVSGIDWVAASMGTALTADQARLAARYAEEVIVAYDGDEAGEEASRRALPILLAQGLKVRRLRLPAGADPDSLRLSDGEGALRARVEEAPDAVDLEIDRQPSADRADPHALARAAQRVRQLLTNVPDQVARFAYSRRAATRLGIPHELLWKTGPEAVAGSGTRPVAGSAGGAIAARPSPLTSSARAGRPAPGPPRQVASLEERVLQLLLSGEVPIPAASELPTPDVFLDPVCGNIFRKFLAVHAGVGGVPDARAVLEMLGETPELLDRAAKILLETSSCSGAVDELGYSLRELTRRWQRDRLRRLALDIGEAQRRGDLVRLDILIQEKNSLTRALHELEA
jgi:DNA primase